MRSPNGSIHTTQTPPLPCHFTIPLRDSLTNFQNFDYFEISVMRIQLPIYCQKMLARNLFFWNFNEGSSDTIRETFQVILVKDNEVKCWTLDNISVKFRGSPFKNALLPVLMHNLYQRHHGRLRHVLRFSEPKRQVCPVCFAWQKPTSIWHNT